MVDVIFPPPSTQLLGLVTGRNHTFCVYTVDIILTVTTIGGGLKLEVNANSKPVDRPVTIGPMLKKETTDPVLGSGVSTVE